MGMMRKARRVCCVAAPTLYLWKIVGTGARIHTWTSARERLLLFSEASSSLRVGRFVEIGSYLGASAVVLAEALRRGRATPERRLYCVDTWMNDATQEDPQSNYDVFLQNTARWGKYIVPVVGDSRKVELPFQGPCDLVFIDGDHSYEGVLSDANRFGPLVRPGGRLVMHDHPRPSVARVVGHLLATGDWRVLQAIKGIISLKRNE